MPSWNGRELNSPALTLPASSVDSRGPLKTLQA